MLLEHSPAAEGGEGAGVVVATTVLVVVACCQGRARVMPPRVPCARVVFVLVCMHLSGASTGVSKGLEKGL